MKNKEKIYNIPNLLSFYRLITVPVLAYFAYTGNEKLFFYAFLFNMFTDALDGFIARNFNMQTELGAKLDSLADSFMYVLAFYAMYHLKWEAFQNYQLSFYLLIFYYFSIDLMALIKFKEISHFHLVSSKLAGVIQGLFFLLLFSKGFFSYLYWLMFFLSTLAFIENTYFIFKLNKMQSNIKGIFWYKNL